MSTPPETNQDSATALDFFLDAFGRVNLALGGGLSIGASVLLWRLVPAAPMPLWIATLIGLPTFMALTSLALALRTAAVTIRRQAREFEHERPTTDIVDAVPPSAPYSHCAILLVVKWSRSAALPIGSNVKIAIAEEHHERHLGLGTVRETLSNGNYVVSIDQAYPDTEVALYIEKLRDKSAKPHLLTRVRIGSTISFQHVPPTMLASFNAPVSPTATAQAAPVTPAALTKAEQ